MFFSKSCDDNTCIFCMIFSHQFLSLMLSTEGSVLVANTNVGLYLQGPVLYESLSRKCEITKISSHPEGKHFMALTREGEVYSWGSGDGGKLGHGDTR